MKGKRRIAWCLAALVVGAVAAGAAQPASAQSVLRMPGLSSQTEPNLAPTASEAPESTAVTESVELPDAPSAVAAKQAQDTVSVDRPAPTAPRPTANSTMGATFIAANALLLASTVANIEMIANCRPSSCQAVPGAIRSRGDLYAIGIPSSLAVSYISYRLKRGGTKLWIVPVAIFTVGNVVYAAHAAQFRR